MGSKQPSCPGLSGPCPEVVRSRVADPLAGRWPGPRRPWRGSSYPCQPGLPVGPGRRRPGWACGSGSSRGLHVHLCRSLPCGPCRLIPGLDPHGILRSAGAGVHPPQPCHRLAVALRVILPAGIQRPHRPTAAAQAHHDRPPRQPVTTGRVASGVCRNTSVPPISLPPRGLNLPQTPKWLRVPRSPHAG